MEPLRNLLPMIGRKNSTLPGPPPEPDPQTCEYCGAVLRYRPVMHPILEGRVSIWLSPARCICPQAAEYWAQVDEEDRRREEAEEARQREIERQRRVERIMRKSQLPPRFQKRTFDSFRETTASAGPLNTAREYADNFKEQLAAGQGLIFTGGVGTGKTHLAAAITLHVLNQGYGAIFGTVTTLLGRIRQTYDDDARETERQVIDELVNVSLLVIDDLGKEKPTAWVEQMLYEIINARYEEERPLIITTNTSMREIQDRYENTGPAIVSRIVEMCRGVKVDGDDWRKGRLK